MQVSSDAAKRQQQQDGAEPGVRADADLFRDPLKQRESEHEQEWKFRQARVALAFRGWRFSVAFCLLRRECCRYFRM